MIKLHARVEEPRDAEPFVARVVRDPAGHLPDSQVDALFVEGEGAVVPGYRAYLFAKEDAEIPDAAKDWGWQIPESIHHLSDGDIIRISPRAGEIWVMYRRHSPSNSMLLTEQCNSRCVMCSQPPKLADDRHLVRAYLEAIPLMSTQTLELGITGGEPTLLGEDLWKIIRECKDRLPTTALHVLSNGRMFNYLRYCQELAAIDHPDLMVGIPLYSDIATRHDFVVQADGAFDQTVRGMMNLARCGVSIEVRLVVHRETAGRLLSFARFLARNLPFVDHVALMGLEMTGFVRMNLDYLWIDPIDYQTELVQAVAHLQRHGMNVSVYNHQLCALDRRLWSVARKSISDWKNEYLEPCRECAERDRCGGFFASSTLRHSGHIRRLAPDGGFAENQISPSPFVIH